MGGGRGSRGPKNGEQAKVEPRAPSCGQQEEGSQAAGGRRLEMPVASAAGATSFIIFPGCVPGDLVFGGANRVVHYRQVWLGESTHGEASLSRGSVWLIFLQGGQPSPGPRLVDVRPAVHFTHLSLCIHWFIRDMLFIQLPWQFSFGT